MTDNSEDKPLCIDDGLFFIRCRLGVRLFWTSKINEFGLNPKPQSSDIR
ncbi:hypothetical protein SAMN04488079_11861 [Methylophaga sulfidovorans]|uniref:Uncharacterized protein n=1 Tax=Methylophaga sulfidovorans TaxID=45496 RepID=A0A1I4BEY1_9GAMM|nr:hypothetical protein SAMN04488079_11861 [Methylophaga sulfidovorans]